MKIEHTIDSPILLKIIPEMPSEIFENGVRSKSFSNMGILHKVKEDGTLILNIDPGGWKDFTEHGSGE